ncbi:MAG: hypothetical protein L3J93_01215 [Thermoplasmata archaeon]|nr:hypothetical protein [Thermoplasmata archaeon]
MGLVELAIAILVLGISAIDAAVPLAVWSRTRDPRFLLVAGAGGCLALLGGIWAWGALPIGAPAYANAELPVLLITLAGAVFLLAASTWPRRG